MECAKPEILVADDEAGFRALFKYLLEPRGFAVSTAVDGEEALDAVRRQDYALVFLDVHMPKLTGPEVLRGIRQIRPRQPVVILSSSPDARQVKEASEAFGVTACFQKPFDTRDILDTIERTLNDSPRVQM